MKAVIQRVKEARVTTGGRELGAIKEGLLVFVACFREDRPEDAGYLAGRLAGLRVFADKAGKMNLSVRDKSLEVMVVSQFTLAADTKKGNRPSFSRAKEPAEAKKLYEYLINCLREQGIKVATGEFAADMQVALVNDGPVTFILESR